jgi:hypothetical protein
MRMRQNKERSETAGHPSAGQVGLEPHDDGCTVTIEDETNIVGFDNRPGKRVLSCHRLSDHHCTRAQTQL